jgi:hypothetical protein
MPRWSSDLRRKLLIDRPLQGRLMLRVGLYWTLYHAALWHTLVFVRYFQHRFAGLSGEAATSFREEYLRALRDSQTLLLAAMVLLPAVIWETLRQSHRIAGPLYRFQATLKSLIAGAPAPQIQLRKGDLLRPFEQTMNEFLEVYAARTAADSKDRPEEEVQPAGAKSLARETV